MLYALRIQSTWLAFLLILVHNATALTFYSNATIPRPHSATTTLVSTENTRSSQLPRLGSFILQGLDNGGTTTTARASTTPNGGQSANHTTSTSYLGTVTSKATYTRLSFTSPTPLHADVWNVTSNSRFKPAAVSKARQCWSDIMTWSSSSAAWWNEQVANRAWPMTSTATPDIFLTSWRKTNYPADVGTYKLCDGTPRVNAIPSTTFSTFNTTMGMYTRTFAATPTFRPQPCDPSPEDCHIWYSNPSIKLVNENALLKQCGNPAHGTEGPCVFGIEGAVELIYFPVETLGSNGSLCTGNGSTRTATPTGSGPNEITTLGHTFTSGSAYMSIKSLSAYIDGFFYTVGPTYTDLILTLASSEISTQCGGIANQATQINWADLNWPVPASAYSCQDRCGHGRLEDQVAATTPTQCSTIWSDVNPLLAIPTMIADLAPEFSTCVLESNGNLANFWFDPRIALQPAAVKAVPTLSSLSSTTPAVAGSSLIKPTPKSTATYRPLQPTITATVDDPRPSSSLQEPMSSAAQPAQSSSSKSEIPNGLGGVSTASVPATEPSAQQSSLGFDASDYPESGASHDTSASTAEAIADPPALSVLTEALPTYSRAPTTVDIPSSGDGQFAGQGMPSSLFSVPTRSTEAAGGAVFTYDPARSARPATTTINGLPEVPDPSDLVFSTNDAGVIIVSSSGNVGVLPTIIGEHPTSVPQALTLTASGIKGSSRPIIIDGQALQTDGVITLFGQTITHGSSGLAIVPARTTEVPDPVSDILHAGDLTLTARPVSNDPNVLVMQGTTPSEGGSAATTSSQVVTQASDGLQIIDSSSTVMFTGIYQPSRTTSGASVEIYVLGSITMTATPDPHYVNGWLVDGTSLSYETGSVVIDGVTITHAWAAMEISGMEMSTIEVAKTATSWPSVVVSTSTRSTSTTSMKSTTSAVTSEVTADSAAAKKWPSIFLSLAATTLVVLIVI